MPAFDKIVVVTQPTALDDLVARYNTRDQARFYLEHNGVPFAGYQSAHDAYHAALATVRAALPAGTRHQFIDRGFLPTVLFGPNDLVVAVGRDGLVVNTAKYLSGQPLVGLNPDPARNDGVLLPFPADLAGPVLTAVRDGRFAARPVTMAQASLNTGPRLLAVNDLFIGQKTHTSARYRLEVGGRAEDQSSSGLIVSTGAGSTGWYRSVLAGAAGVVERLAGGAAKRLRTDYRFDWDARELRYCVREPFPSKTSAAGLVYGTLPAGDELVVTSQMPQGGTVFSDGIEADGLEFVSGTVLRVTVADRTLTLVTRAG